MVQPVYNLLGYATDEIKYINDHKDNTYIGISVIKDYFNEETKQYSIFIRIATDFSSEESYFIFQGAFQINDMKWFKSLNESDKKSIFFAVIFPFAREKVLSITSDTNPGLFIPTINIKDFDFTKELRLIRSTSNRINN